MRKHRIAYEFVNGRQKRMATGKYIAYLRVSTDKQGRSGLGLEAQREAVTRYLNGGKWTLVLNTSRPRAESGMTAPSSLPHWHTRRPLVPRWCSRSSID
jgi:hypothetical protein